MAKVLLLSFALLLIAVAAVAEDFPYFSVEELEQSYGDKAAFTDDQKEIMAERIFNSPCLLSGTVAERPLIDKKTGVSAVTLRIVEKPIVGKYAVVGFLPNEVGRVKVLKRGQKVIVLGHLVQYNGYPNPVYGRSRVDKIYMALMDAVFK